MRTTLAFVIAIVLVALAWLFAEKAFAGFRLKVSGLAPHAASYAGFSEKHGVKPGDQLTFENIPAAP